MPVNLYGGRYTLYLHCIILVSCGVISSQKDIFVTTKNRICRKHEVKNIAKLQNKVNIETVIENKRKIEMLTFERADVVLTITDANPPRINSERATELAVTSIPVTESHTVV